MSDSIGPDIEDRLASVESAIAALAARVDEIGFAGPRADSSTSSLAASGATDATPRGAGNPTPPPARASRAPRAPPWLTTRSAEWWLGRIGILFLCLALILLYDYAVDRNWITPLVRVITGIGVGAGLLYAGSRMSRPRSDTPTPNDIGLRELLLGGGLAAWYITAYAAAARYNLITIPTARLLYVALSILAAWIGLVEKRSIFGLVAIVAGFAAPFLLSAGPESILAFAPYVAALTALGTLLYLMRGWQSVLWTTFLLSWAVVVIAANNATGRRSVSLTLLLVAMAAAFVRVPSLRRRLLETGSSRYTPATPSRFGDWLLRVTNRIASVAGEKLPQPDSPALWIIALASPLFMVWAASNVWPEVTSIAWGGVLFVAGLAAFRMSGGSDRGDAELQHVQVTAASLWTLFGLLWAADGVGRALGTSADSIVLAVASLHAVAVLELGLLRSYRAPRKLAYFTAALCLFAVLSEEASGFRPLPPWQTVAELIAIAVAAVVWKRLRSNSASRVAAILSGLGAYIALLMIVDRVLGAIWTPLVTAVYAIAGAALLVASKRVVDRSVLRKLGGLTMLLVVFRLFVIDLAGVETIWRVLLFMLCGLLFLYTSQRLQAERGPPPPSTT